MKNQYFGDINDYKKYGLLRAISSASNLSILIAWMLTENDGSTDGKFIQYLQEPEKWEHYDPPLYRELANLLNDCSERNVGLIEDSVLLNGSDYYSKLVPDDATGRNFWSAELASVSSNSDMVFLDPDNGLEIVSKPYGRKNSSKFLYWREVNALWSDGKSLLIYQHFIREKREMFISRMLDALSEKMPDSILEAYSTSNVVFFMVLQPDHHQFHVPITDFVKNTWSNQFKRWNT